MDYANKSGRVPWGRILLLGCVAAGGPYWAFFRTDVHCRPAANETMLGLRRAVGTEVVHWLGANKPAYKLDPGFLEHPRLSPGPRRRG